MTGRLVTEYEPWLTAEMLSISDDTVVTPMVFAEILRAGHQTYVMEDEQGVVAVLVYFVPPRYNIFLGMSAWIRPDIRGETLLDDIFNEVLDLTGASMFLAQPTPWLLESGIRRGMPPLLTVREGVPKFPGYYHEGVYIHAVNRT